MLILCLVPRLVNQSNCWSCLPSSTAAPGGNNPPNDGDEWVDRDTGDRYIFGPSGWEKAPCCGIGITGPTGVSITSVTVNATGNLLTGFSDGTTGEAGM